LDQLAMHGARTSTESRRSHTLSNHGGSLVSSRIIDLSDRLFCGIKSMMPEFMVGMLGASASLGNRQPIRIVSIQRWSVLRARDFGDCWSTFMPKLCALF
jgi:hypothetical protein